jgi:phosphatidate cytidylyltransferase
MSKNLKIRIYTSIALLLSLLVIMLNNYALAFFLMLIGIFAVLEFFNIILKIFKRNRIKQFLYNLIFTSYIFIFCSYFFVLSFFFHLKIILFLVLITCVASDIGGFIFGKIFKGPKLTTISPNKTVSGALGSLIFSSLIISALFYLADKSFDPSIVVIGCLISISCQVGDLFFSFLKRKSSLKDSGNFLPGHGGVLDRCDGLLLGVPVGFLILLLSY